MPADHQKCMDMDYLLKLRIAPDTATKIPLLDDNFNLQGYRLAQQNLELGFRVSGPTFNPQGQLAKLPRASVTLVSGMFEVTSEALKLIDTPRRILVDLLRTGGGIVGAAAN